MGNHLDATQRAAAVLAARARGDREGAAALLGDFDDPQSMAFGFFAIAELAVQLHAADTGQSPADLAGRLTLDVAVAADEHRDHHAT